MPHETELAHHVIKMLKDKYIIGRHPCIDFHPSDDSMTDVRGHKQSSIMTDWEWLQDKLLSEIQVYRNNLTHNAPDKLVDFDEKWK